MMHEESSASSRPVIRLGLIGVGGMAYAHRGAIAQLEGLRIAALCDSNEAALREIGELEGIPAQKRYVQMEAMIADPEVDAVISIVPNHVHAEVIRLCIAQGKPLMAEKPFTLDLEEAERLRPLYEARPIPCMVGFSYRYIPAFRYAKALLAQGTIGAVRHIDIRYLQSGGAPIFETPHLWRFNKRYTGTGVLGDLGSHMIDSARYFVGEFRSVSAVMATFVPERADLATGEMTKVDVDDCACFHAELDGGVLGSFVTTRNAVGYGNYNEVALYGDLGSIRVNCERPNELDLSVRREAGEWPTFRTVEVPAEYARPQLLDFAQLVREGNAPEGMPGFDDGYENQKVLERLIESAEKGHTVRV